MIAEHPEPVRLVILYVGLVPRLDLAGAELIKDLHKTLAARRIALRLADAHGQVRDALRRIGFEEGYGPLEAGRSVDVVLAEWQAATATTGATV
jgi:hypothetical protein